MKIIAMLLLFLCQVFSLEVRAQASYGLEERYAAYELLYEELRKGDRNEVKVAYRFVADAFYDDDDDSLDGEGGGWYMRTYLYRGLGVYAPQQDFLGPKWMHIDLYYEMAIATRVPPSDDFTRKMRAQKAYILKRLNAGFYGRRKHGNIYAHSGIAD